MTDQTPHRTLENGAIDYAHYLEKGREMRSAEIRDAVGRLRRAAALKRRLSAVLRAEPEFPPIMASQN